MLCRSTSIGHFQLVVVDRAPHCPPGLPFNPTPGASPRIYALCSLQFGLDERPLKELAVVLRVLDVLESSKDVDIESVAQSEDLMKADQSIYANGLVNVKVCCAVPFFHFG